MGRKEYRRAESEKRKLNLVNLIEKKYGGMPHKLGEVLKADHPYRFTERRFRQMMRGDVLIWPSDARDIERAVGLEDRWLDKRRWRQFLNEDENTVLSIIRSCRDGSATTESMTRLLELIAHLTKPREVLPPSQDPEAR